jgi:hypothetical protein
MSSRSNLKLLPLGLGTITELKKEYKDLGIAARLTLMYDFPKSGES